MNWSEASQLLKGYYEATKANHTIHGYAGMLESHLSFLLSDESEKFKPIIMQQILDEILKNEPKNLEP